MTIMTHDTLLAPLSFVSHYRIQIPTQSDLLEPLSSGEVVSFDS